MTDTKSGSSLFFVGWRTDRRNRKIANQGEEEVIITVTVADSFGYRRKVCVKVNNRLPFKQ